jgi:hypothetical protein
LHDCRDAAGARVPALVVVSQSVPRLPNAFRFSFRWASRRLASKLRLGSRFHLIGVMAAESGTDEVAL